jgi:hypothetical protein
MSKELDRAQAQYRAGDYKRAVDTLWEVPFLGIQAEADAHSVVALASLLRNVTQGSARRDCDEHIERAERFLDSGTDDERARAGELLRQLRDDAVREASKAAAAGLGWFELRRTVDIVATEAYSIEPAEQSAAAPRPVSTIDAVEAEGWRLEHVACMFRPTTVQTSVLRGAEYIMGGDLVDGEEIHIYLFRRSDRVSDRIG